LNLRKKNWFVCTLWLSVYMKSVVEQGFFHEFAFNNKVLKTFVKFWICWKCSKFECCWIRIRTSSYYSASVSSVFMAIQMLLLLLLLLLYL